MQSKNSLMELREKYVKFKTLRREQCLRPAEMIKGFELSVQLSGRFHLCQHNGDYFTSVPYKLVAILKYNPKEMCRSL